MHLNAFAISNLLIVLTCLPLAIVVFIHGKTNLSRVYSLHALAVGLWGLGAFFATTTNSSNTSLFLWRFAYCAVIFIPVFFLHTVFLLTPNFNKPLLLFSYLQGMFFILFNSSAVSSVKFMFGSFYYARGHITYFVSFFIWVMLVFVGHYILIKFYIRNKEKQYFLFLIAMICGFGGGVINCLVGFGFNIYPWPNFLIPFYVFIMAFAIFKYQIFDIKVTIQRGVVYSILVTLITVSYLIFVLLIEKLFQGMIGYRSLLLSTIYAFVIAIFFNPVRNKIQHLADRIFLGKDPLQIAQENELLKQELEKSERLKAVASLAAGMAHEIKNPLTALKTFAEYLPQKANDPEFIPKFSQIVSREVGRIDNLVHQLLEFAKPSPLKIEEVDIHKLLDDILGFLSNDLLKHNIKVIKEFNPDLVQFPLKGDLNKLKQAFLNLFINAIDAMPSGGTLTVLTLIRENPRGEKSAEIHVQDTGYGITEKDLAHLFEPFHSTKEQGTGLGLSITYGIIKEHRGDVSVESKLKEGTKFTIELPIN
jgi:signal transduction histidine kinase